MKIYDFLAQGLNFDNSLSKSNNGHRLPFIGYFYDK